jgi:hypothetical protein
MKRILLLVLVAGCCRSAPIDVGYASVGNEGWAGAVIAAGAWNIACGETMVVLRRGDGDWLVVENDHLDAERGLAGTTHRYGVIEFDVVEPPAMTIAHEFGHAMGLGHASRGIMRSDNSGDKMRDGVIAPGQIIAADCASALR